MSTTASSLFFPVYSEALVENEKCIAKGWGKVRDPWSTRPLKWAVLGPKKDGTMGPEAERGTLLGNAYCSREGGNRRGFPGGPVVKNPPANAGDTGSIPALGRSHVPRDN